MGAAPRASPWPLLLLLAVVIAVGATLLVTELGKRSEPDASPASAAEFARGVAAELPPALARETVQRSRPSELPAAAKDAAPGSLLVKVLQADFATALPAAGAVVTAARVTATGEVDPSTARTARTEDDGECRFPDLELGAYAVVAEFEGRSGAARAAEEDVREGREVWLGIPASATLIVDCSRLRALREAFVMAAPGDLASGVPRTSIVPPWWVVFARDPPMLRSFEIQALREHVVWATDGEGTTVGGPVQVAALRPGAEELVLLQPAAGGASLTISIERPEDRTNAIAAAPTQVRVLVATPSGVMLSDRLRWRSLPTEVSVPVPDARVVKILVTVPGYGPVVREVAIAGAAGTLHVVLPRSASLVLPPVRSWPAAAEWRVVLDGMVLVLPARCRSDAAGLAIDDLGAAVSGVRSSGLWLPGPFPEGSRRTADPAPGVSVLPLEQRTISAVAGGDARVAGIVLALRDTLSASEIGRWARSAATPGGEEWFPIVCPVPQGRAFEILVWSPTEATLWGKAFAGPLSEGGVAGETASTVRFTPVR